MMYRLVLAAFLSLPCLALVGCGGSSSSNGSADPSTAPLSPDEVAKAQAAQNQAADDERAVRAAEAPKKAK